MAELTAIPADHLQPAWSGPNDCWWLQGPQCVAANLQTSSRYILEMQPGSYDCKVVLRDDAEPSDVLRAAVEAHVISGCLQVSINASRCRLEDLQQG